MILKSPWRRFIGLFKGGFLNFGVFPVLLAAGFQALLIVKSKENLSSFFFFQSVISVGVSIFLLQPRYWKDQYLRDRNFTLSLVICLVFLTASCVGVVLFSNGSSLLWYVYIAKRAEDAFKEVAFVKGVDAGRNGLMVVVADICSLALVFIGAYFLALAAYLAICFFLAKVYFGNKRIPFTALRDLPNLALQSVYATFYNMGSRIYLIASGSQEAHFFIGAILQSVNFVSPFVFKISRFKGRVKKMAAYLFLLTPLVFLGAYLISIFAREAVGYHLSAPMIFMLSGLAVVNAGSVIDFFRSKIRWQWGAFLAFLMLMCIVVARFARWEIAYPLFVLFSILTIWMIIEIDHRRSNL